MSSPTYASVTQAAQRFVQLAAQHYAVQQALLFGSYARGNAHAESDADVALLLRGEPAPFVATKLALDDLAYEVLLDTGIRVQPLPIWENEWRMPQNYNNPRLLENIAREGKRL